MSRESDSLREREGIVGVLLIYIALYLRERVDIEEVLRIWLSLTENEDIVGVSECSNLLESEVT